MFCFVFLIFFTSFSRVLYTSDCPGFHQVAQDDPKLTVILLPQFKKQNKSHQIPRQMRLSMLNAQLKCLLYDCLGNSSLTYF